MYPVITLGTSLQIPTYSLLLSLVFCFALILVLIISKKQQYDQKLALDLGMLLILSGFIGARAMHVLYEAPLFYLQSPLQIFYIWQGGFVYLGGVIVAFYTSFRYLKSKGQNPLMWYDLIVPIFSFTYALGRTACLMAGCCYGKVCELPWAIQFLDEHGGFLRRHPTQIYLILWEVVVLLFLFKLKATQKTNPKFLATPGSLFFSWVGLHSLGRFIIEFYRDDFRGIIWGLSISAWLSLAFGAFSVAFLLHKKTSKS